MDDRIDFYLDKVLRASGSALRNYSVRPTLDAMREAMREAMTEGLVGEPRYTLTERGRELLEGK
jgi:hypothetical protein